MFSDIDLRLASFTDPRFKLSWIADSAVEHSRAKQQLIEAFRREVQDFNECDQDLLHNDSCDSSDESSPKKIKKNGKKKDFFSSIRRPKSPSETKEVEEYLKDPIGSLEQLNRYPVIKKIFK